MSWVPASGLKGLLFSMPMELSWSIMALSRVSQGSIWTMRLRDSIEAHVVRNGCVEDHVDGVDELGVRRTMSLRERVDLDPFAIGDCIGNISVAAALQVGTKECIALVGCGWHGNVSGGNVLFVAGWQDEVLAALALVDPCRSDVLDGRLPAVVH